jgi:PAS domain-containing protein
MVIVDTGNTVVAWNAAMEQLTGKPAADVVGKKGFYKLLPFHDPSRPSLTELFDADDASLERHYPGAHRDGTAIVAQVRGPAGKTGTYLSFTIKASPILDPDGASLGAIEIIRQSSTDIRNPAGSFPDGFLQGSPGPDHMAAK